jgi:hypothetical protein
VTLDDRLLRLEILAHPDPIVRDLEVIRLQLTRAEGKILRGHRDARRELRIIEQRVDRAERRLAALAGI